MRTSRAWWFWVLCWAASSSAGAQAPLPTVAQAEAHGTAHEQNEAAAGVPAREQNNEMPRFSLADALRLMRSSHPLILAQEFEVEASENEAVEAGLWSNPSLQPSYFRGIAHSSYDRRVGYISYGITQFVELTNVPGMRRRQRNLLVSAARAERVNVEAQQSLTVESTLIDLVAAQRTMDLLTRVLSLIDSAGRIVNERVAAGAAPRYDASRIAVTLAIAQADQAEASASLVRAWAEFSAAVGPRAVELKGEPDYDLNTGPNLADIESLLDQLARLRPDLAAARARAAAAETGIHVARRAVFPGMAVTLQGGYGAAALQVDVGAALSIPLPIIDRGQATIPAAQARARQAVADVNAITVPASARIVGMHGEILRRRTALSDYQSRGVTSGEEMLSEAQAGYLAGRFSVLELVDAYRAFRDARLREIDLGAAARQAEIDLGRELGRPLRSH